MPQHRTGTEVAKELAPHIRDKVVLVTGASPGSLGAQFCLAISAHSPKLIIVAGRDAAKLEATRKTLHQCPSQAWQIDQSSLKGVHDAVQSADFPQHIDVLLCCAGIMACPFSLTSDKLERQFAVNHVSHFLLTKLLIERGVLQKESSRIVNVSSNGYRLSPLRFEDVNFDKGSVYDPWLAYGQSKTANNLQSVALAARGWTSFSVHPGAIKTNLGRDLDEDAFEEVKTLARKQGNVKFLRDFQYKTPDEGVASFVVAAFDPAIVDRNGSYLEDCTPLPPQEVISWGRDAVEAEKLWTLSEGLV